MNDEIRILIGGDLALLGCAESTPGRPFTLTISEEVKKLFRRSDVNIINLESPLTESNNKILKTGPHLRSNPDSIKLLSDLNINIACLSNNHIRDYGDEGVKDTIDTCRDVNIDIVGAGSDVDEASKPLILKVKGKKIAVLNFSESEFNTASDLRAGSNPDDPIHIWRTFEGVKGKVDFIIVIMHGGKEMHPYPTPHQFKLFRFVADLGADAVIGHHSHVMGGYEIYKNKPIIYSLGNFIFDEKNNVSTWYKGVVAELILDKREIKDVCFFHTFLDFETLKLVGSQNWNIFNNRETFISYLNKSIIIENWKKFIKKNANKSIKNIIKLNIFERLLIKLKLKKIKIKNYSELLTSINKFKCQSHREYYEEIISYFLEGK